MNLKYTNWIKENYPTPNSALNACAEACKALCLAFPELTATNGYIRLNTEIDNPRTHWWCVTKEGEIIDPTSHQYQVFNSVIIEYEEIDDSHDLRNYPQGRCANCGEYYFIGKNNWSCQTTCSSKCFTSYAKYLNSGDF